MTVPKGMKKYISPFIKNGVVTVDGPFLGCKVMGPYFHQRRGNNGVYYVVIQAPNDKDRQMPLSKFIMSVKDKKIYGVGHKVDFLDGDRTNFEVSNLNVRLSRQYHKEQMEENGIPMISLRDSSERNTFGFVLQSIKKALEATHYTYSSSLSCNLQVSDINSVDFAIPASIGINGLNFEIRNGKAKIRVFCDASGYYSIKKIDEERSIVLADGNLLK